MEYDPCGPACPQTCQDFGLEPAAPCPAEAAACLEGCFCPEGKVLHGEARGRQQSWSKGGQSCQAPVCQARGAKDEVGVRETKTEESSLSCAFVVSFPKFQGWEGPRGPLKAWWMGARVKTPPHPHFWDT